jgi:hypothetical protein
MGSLISKIRSINFYFIFNRHILMVDSTSIHNDYQFQNLKIPTLEGTGLYLIKLIFNFEKRHCIHFQFET